MLWRSQDEYYKDRKLRIGVIRETDGMCTAHPPVARAVNEVVSALEAAGHEVFDWEPTGHKELVGVFLQNGIYHSGPLMKMVADSGEPLLPMLAHFKAAYDAGADPFRSHTQQDLTLLRDRLIDAYFDRWADTATESQPEMDAILSPLSPWAMPPVRTTDRVMSLSWTCFANVLGEFQYHWLLEKSLLPNSASGRHSFLRFPCHDRRQGCGQTTSQLHPY